MGFPDDDQLPTGLPKDYDDNEFTNGFANDDAYDMSDMFLTQYNGLSFVASLDAPPHALDYGAIQFPKKIKERQRLHGLMIASQLHSGEDFPTSSSWTNQ